jgi:hypothetical protein
VRVFHFTFAKATGLQELVPGLMDRRFVMMQGANQGYMIQHPGEQREVLAQQYAGQARADSTEWAAYILRRLGLGVPGVELAGSTHEEELNARRGRASGPGMQRRPLAQAQTDRRTARAQKIPT